MTRRRSSAAAASPTAIVPPCRLTVDSSIPSCVTASRVVDADGSAMCHESVEGGIACRTASRPPSGSVGSPAPSAADSSTPSEWVVAAVDSTNTATPSAAGAKPAAVVVPPCSKIGVNSSISMERITSVSIGTSRCIATDSPGRAPTLTSAALGVVRRSSDCRPHASCRARSIPAAVAPRSAAVIGGTRPPTSAYRCSTADPHGRP